MSEYFEDYTEQYEDDKDRALFDIYIDNNYQKYIFDEIKRRDKVLLIEFGEEGWIYQRRWEGVLCTHPTIKTDNTVDDRSRLNDMFDSGLQDESDQNTNVEIIHRCPDCFGTGYFGGYFKKKILMFRYGNIPQRIIRMTNRGVEVANDFNSWTLADPVLHEKDVIVRQNGERFFVSNPGYSEWRGVKLHQVMMLNKIEPKDIAYTITDEAIDLALNNITTEQPEDWTKFKEGN